MKRYESAPPRALAALAAVAMSVLTLSASILAPVTVDAGQHDALVSTLSATPQDHAFANSGPLTTSIDVVAYRSTRLVPAVHTRAVAHSDLAS